MAFGFRGTVGGKGGSGGGAFCPTTGSTVNKTQAARKPRFQPLDAFIRIGAELSSSLGG